MGEGQSLSGDDHRHLHLQGRSELHSPTYSFFTL
jgi:hypothetical protein